MNKGIMESVKDKMVGSIKGTGEVLNAAVDTVSGTLVTTWDAGVHRQPNFDVFGSQGTLALKDPNTFGGPILLSVTMAAGD